jgi:SAM-dependent methyltransferase
MAVDQFEHPDFIYNTQSAKNIIPIIQDWFNPASVLDVGCGNGSWLKAWMEEGLTDILGVDGNYVNQQELLIPVDKFVPHNLEEPLDLNRRFDIVFCLEVGEHLDEKFSTGLIQSLTRHSDTIIFSAAIPGQGGDRHINEKEPAFWQKIFNEAGYHTYDIIRPLIWENDEIYWWYRQNMFVAAKKGMFPGKDEKIRHLVHPELLKITFEDFSDKIYHLNNPGTLPRYFLNRLWKRLKRI